MKNANQEVIKKLARVARGAKYLSDEMPQNQSRRRRIGAWWLAGDDGIIASYHQNGAHLVSGGRYALRRNRGNQRAENALSGKPASALHRRLCLKGVAL